MGKLAVCPKNKRNCVSSLDQESNKFKVDPFPFKGPTEEALQKLYKILCETDHCEIISQEENYIHCVFQTKVLKFKDDVEFYVNENKNAIDVRSASRLGHYDFKKNRKRVRDIRAAFLAEK
ncbi:DUF1499 domain-containing protein [Alteribacter aurantiacus]|uniref:DUF1499 domain-containing protein n=1 Tax=Alteribacter aurantiacus TaxID=254410 RepID=UPI00040D2A6F|nr:DUF1499 domain-containing protein [Alteribacter aurantiacus]